MSNMTKEQLAEFVKEQTIPVVKEAIGSDIANIVRDNVERVANDPNGPWAKRWTNSLLDGNGKPEAPVREKGVAFARCVRAMAAAKMHKLGSAGVVDILKQWGDGDLAERGQCPSGRICVPLVCRLATQAVGPLDRAGNPVLRFNLHGASRPGTHGLFPCSADDSVLLGRVRGRITLVMALAAT